MSEHSEWFNTKQLEQMLEHVDPKEREEILEELYARKHPMFID